MLAVACSTGFHHGSREVSISECDVTWRTVKVDSYCPLATTIHAISHMTFPAFDFSSVSCMRLLFQLQGQYCFSFVYECNISEDALCELRFSMSGEVLCI